MTVCQQGKQQPSGQTNEERTMRAEAMEANMTPLSVLEPSPGVLEWYEGRTVLMTGGAGFMGKVILEKMLRALPGLKRVYLVLRAKRGVAPQRRLQDMFQLPVFERLRHERPDAVSKVVAVEGDLLLPGLGLSDSDRARLQGEVSVVIHGAATLRLEAEMAFAIKHNVLGTRRLLELAQGMPNLKAFVHLSTAFCHPEEQELKEHTYPAPAPPDELLKLSEWLGDDALARLTPRLLGLHPNCYTYSKKLAEALVDEFRSEVPVLIVRPSIVTPTLQEPMPGWVDSLNGPVGLGVGAGKGVIRSMMCGKDYLAEVMPVDIAANVIIVAAWNTAVFRSHEKQTPVYNASTGDVVQVKWGDVLDCARHQTLEIPFEGVVWYPDGDIRTSRLAHNLIVFFFHTIPAYLIDLLLILMLQKTFMVRLQRRISRGMILLEYFTMRKWHFHNKNVLAMERRLSLEEHCIFYISNVEVNVDKYMRNAIYGARVYCLKEPPSSLPRARVHLKIMYVVHVLAKFAFWASLVYLLVSHIEPVRSMLDIVSTGFMSNSFFRTLAVEGNNDKE